MSENKRYYWLKLNETFFEDDTVAWLEEQKNGKDYVIFYLKLALKSLANNGVLIRYVGQRLIPYDVNALAKLTNTEPDTVAVAMKLFLDIGLVEQFDSGEIYLSQINELIGSETDSAKRVRKHRLLKEQKESLLQCNDNVTKCNANNRVKSKELDKDIDKEKKQVKKEKNLYFENEKVNNLFIEFLEMRKKLKAVNSERAVKMLINKLEPFSDSVKLQMIENSLVSSWKSVYELKGSQKEEKKYELPKNFKGLIV